MYQFDQSGRRKTRSHQQQDKQEHSRAQIPSQSLLGPQGVQIDSNRVIKQAKPATRKSNWSKKERIRYFVFLNYYSQIPYWGSDLKSIPTYKSLSIFVKSRSPEQCKSFHLSTRRNFKSIDEMLKGLKQQLQEQQGFKKLLDRYQIQIIMFENQHKLLELHGLLEKTYFHSKLVERYRANDHPNENFQQFPDLPKTHEPKLNIQNKNAHDKPEDNFLPESHNFKFNIKQFMGETQNQPKNDKKNSNYPQVKNNIPSIKDTQNFFPMLGNRDFPQISGQEGLYRSSGMERTFNTGQLMGGPSSALGYFNPEGAFSVIPQNKNPPTFETIKDPNTRKLSMEGLRPDLTNNQSQQQFPLPMSNQSQSETERMMINQQHFNRFIQANKSMYGAYQNFSPFQNSPFSPLNPIHLAQQQFRNQLQFSIPPPGGIPYLLQGYNDPYNMAINPIQASRFGPNLLPQHSFSSRIAEKEKQHKQTIDQQQKQHKQQISQNTDLRQTSTPQQYSQNRKRLLLECHRHWVNWLRAAAQIHRKKQALQQTTTLVNN